MLLLQSSPESVLWDVAAGIVKGATSTEKEVRSALCRLLTHCGLFLST